MAKKTWAFTLNGSAHTVDLEHGYWSGKRTISVDGVLIEQSRKVIDMGSRHTFSVDSYEATLTISVDGFTYGYALDIRGVPVRGEGEEISLAGLPAPVVEAASSYGVMLHRIRSGAYAMLGLGGLHLLWSGFLNAPWGILLVLVGLASFLFHDAAMFIVYGATLAWAAISNLTAGSARGIVLAAVEALLALSVLQQFRGFLRAEQDQQALALVGAAKDPAAGRAARIFPALGCLLGLFSLGGAQATFVVMVLMGEAAPLGVLNLVVACVLNLAVLGLAVSLASFLAGYRYKILAGFGAAASSLVLILTLALAILG